MEESHDLQNILTLLKKQELVNAHVISVLEGRHIPQFTALKRTLDGKSLAGLDELKRAFHVYTDRSCPGMVVVVWESEPCEHWHAPARKVIEVSVSTKADLSCLEEPVLNAIADEQEICIVTSDVKARDWVRDNCKPIAWHMNVIYTAQKPRYRPKPGVAVRLLTARDEKAVAEFVERAGPDEHGSTSGQYALAKQGMFYKCYGTFHKDTLTGFLTLFERTANVREILWVRVDAEYRGRGIGSALLTKVTDDIMTAGKIPMYLTTPSNLPALTMISSLGFTFAYERYTAQITEV